ncbi:MAG: 16S rRNA (cytosine(967)-C(5))-methyltransferase RsmB [Clostridiales bacterium]|nr:16S rRNA (cytosine(967)-C(5))-methyltransferase RsmB [Clostridiales bacterium]
MIEMDANRKTAYFALADVESKKSYSNLALNHHIICGKPGSPAFVRELVYGVLENKMLLDYLIDRIVPTGSAKIKTSDRIVLRMGIYQLEYMNSVPEYAAVNESVELAKRFCRGRQGFINASLRAFIKGKYAIGLPDRGDDEVRHLSVRYSYEPWIVELWLGQYNADFVEELLKAGNAAPDLVVRANSLKTTRDELVQRLAASGCVVEIGNLCDEAIHIKKGTALIDNNLYRGGMYSIQDEASMFVAAMLDPRPGDTVMDVCAAPGGKTMAIAERMGNTGRVVASDVYIRKLNLIEKEAKRLGISIVETRTWDATKVDSEMTEKADKVLVDAPCTGLGTVRRKPEIKYKKRTADMDSLPAKQLLILTASSKYVKPGGTLIYSTCTINPNENQKVTGEFLKRNPSFKKEEAIQLMPNVNGTDGFFICKMQRAEVLAGTGL